jgi:CheY-like chemotaxis protein
VLDLNDTVSGIFKMLRRIVGENIELVWKPGLNLWPVMMDPSQIDQILANLTVNARDAIELAGNLTIATQNIVFDKTYCSAHAGFMPGEYVLLAVSDNGCGMDKQVLDNLFEPFFTTKGVGKGTGLGLATIYGIVKQNNGFINVYSEPGEGTSFKIYLPRIQASETAKAPIIEKEPSRGAETVLLVEDEKAILRLGKMILERYGYTVIAAESPAEALTFVKEYHGPIDLLITDVVMPGMNGKELKERITAIIPEIRVLFMSGYTANVIAYHGVIEEDVQYLQKPFSVKTLAAKVREVLERKKSNS